MPSRNEKKREMYKVVRRLARKSNDKIVPHFFWCSICKTILHINTSTHYPALGRHYKKCVENRTKGLFDFPTSRCLNNI